MDPALVEANVAMLQAQARMFDRQAADFDVSATLKAAEARQKVAHALAAEYGAEQVRIQTEASLRQEKLSLASNHHYHEYLFVGSVREDEVDTCLAQMAVWDRLDANCDMHIVMDSPGGSVIDGMHLFDQISAYSKRPWDTRDLPKGTHSTKVTVRGYAASMAGILLQAADERVIGPESYLMIHEIATYTGGKIGEIKDEVKFLDTVSDRVANIFVRRSNGKISLEDFKKSWNRQDWWLSSEQALEFGFVDRIG